MMITFAVSHTWREHVAQRPSAAPASLCAEEFLAAVHALEHRHFAAFGSGVREIYGVFSRLRSEGFGANTGYRQPPPLRQWFVPHLVTLSPSR